MDVKGGRVARWLVVTCLSVCVGLLCLDACMEGAPASPRLDTDATSSGDAGADSAVAVGCPEGGYPTCPSMVPSYSAQVRPIIDVWCAPCHFNGGSGTGKGDDFSTLEGFRYHLDTELQQLVLCLMPPADAAVLSPANRKALLEWLVCDGPDN
jgi:hypothetical protein